jgi:hypothetical protein
MHGGAWRLPPALSANCWQILVACMLHELLLLAALTSQTLQFSWLYQSRDVTVSDFPVSSCAACAA